MAVHDQNLTRSPGVVELAATGELERRASAAEASLARCALCPRECGVDRLGGERGFCGAGSGPRVYRHMAHPGEEPPISGSRGSGTIFFSHCTMACVYCQNYRMSRRGEGHDRSPAELADMMLDLAGAGCHNVNIVSGTQFLPSVLRALVLAVGRGLRVPLVWNTAGYEFPAALELLDGVVDVYLADLRYTSADAAGRLSDAPDYVEVNRAALLTMRRQVGALVTDDVGIAVSGLIVRHLVLPGNASGTREALGFIASELGRETAVSLMAQYYPAHRAREHAELGRRINRGEWARALSSLESAGLETGWVQEYPLDVARIAGTEIEPDPATSDRPEGDDQGGPSSDRPEGDERAGPSSGAQGDSE